MHEINLSGQPVDLDLTLCCGQAFRWRKTPDGTWHGVVGACLVELTQEGDSLFWRTFPESDGQLVCDYFRLADDVKRIYGSLAESDPALAELVERFKGLRILRQDPEETLLSFVCSAANSIPRITASVEALAATYGQPVCVLGDRHYHTFPSLDSIAITGRPLFDDTQLLGFRDPKLRQVACQVRERRPGWLHSLRDADYAQAYEGLIRIKGVGPKISDCVCLFSLDKDEAVPVDTHVCQMAQRMWGLDLSSRTLTDAVRNRIKREFADRYGPYAGWAQQFLFYDDLLRTRSLGRGVRWCQWSVE